MLVECAWSYQFPPRLSKDKQVKVEAVAVRRFQEVFSLARQYRTTRPPRNPAQIRPRSRSRADRLGDCPDETEELTSHRRNGDVLELASPEQLGNAD
jgi:hypothetical protein